MGQPEFQRLDFRTDGGLGQRARIGLIVLETDQTIEFETRLLNLADVAWYHARIANEDEVNPTTLTAMEQRLPKAAQLLPPAFQFDAVGYACTSAATLIGERGVRAAIQSVHAGTPVSNPISAAAEAFKTLGVRRLAVVTPYTAEVTAPIVKYFADHDFLVSRVGSFLEPSDHVVARISEESVAAAVRSVSREPACDAVFVSCTSLRTFGIVGALEAELGIPVVSSNLALLWHLLRMAGVSEPTSGFGRLLQEH